MPWAYSQRFGSISAPGGTAVLEIGYSGHGAGKNNPEAEADKGVGPIPAGKWKLGAAYDHPHLGPQVMPLEPIGHNAHGRTEFFVHGDSRSHPGLASHGCIILGRATRDFMAKRVAAALEGAAPIDDAHLIVF